MYTLYVSMDLDRVRTLGLQLITNAVEVIFKQNGGVVNGAGAGFGFRDIDGDFRTIKNAKRAKEEVEKFCSNTGIRCEASCRKRTGR